MKTGASCQKFDVHTKACTVMFHIHRVPNIARSGCPWNPSAGLHVQLIEIEWCKWYSSRFRDCRLRSMKYRYTIKMDYRRYKRCWPFTHHFRPGRDWKALSKELAAMLAQVKTGTDLWCVWEHKAPGSSTSVIAVVVETDIGLALSMPRIWVRPQQVWGSRSLHFKLHQVNERYFMVSASLD